MGFFLLLMNVLIVALELLPPIESEEHQLQYSDAFDPEQTVGFGKLVGAELLIVAKLTLTKSGASLFARLVRVQTGEMLSVAKVQFGETVLDRS